MRFLVEVEHPDGRRQENEWTADQLLAPNGSEPFIAWFLRELESRGGAKVRIETIEHSDDLPGFYGRTGP